MSQITFHFVNQILTLKARLGWAQCILELGWEEHDALKQIAHTGPDGHEDFPAEIAFAKGGVALVRSSNPHGISLYPL